jgi:hypothetical protein
VFVLDGLAPARVRAFGRRRGLAEWCDVGAFEDSEARRDQQGARTPAVVDHSGAVEGEWNWMPFAHALRRVVAVAWTSFCERFCSAERVKHTHTGTGTPAFIRLFAQSAPTS